MLTILYARVEKYKACKHMHEWRQGRSPNVTLQLDAGLDHDASLNRGNGKSIQQVLHFLPELATSITLPSSASDLLTVCVE